MDPPTDALPGRPASPSRRTLLLGSLGAVGAAAVGGLAGYGIGRLGDTAQAAPAVSGASTIAPVPATGRTQAGVSRPATPQAHGLLLVADIGGDDLGFLAAVSESILAMTGTDASTHVDVLPDGPGDLTVTIGIGPRLVAAADASLPGAEDLPLFAGDDAIDAARRGGDILIAAYSSDPTILGPVVDHLHTLLPSPRVRWRQRMFRAPGEGTVARNPLGFHDGIVVPHGAEELDENVWLDGALDGATICVIRRLRLDTDAFLAMREKDQEATIGRKKSSGAPLSGGERDSQVDLLAKTPDGQFIVPLHSHARAAHPSFTGSGLMLRRGYGYDNGETSDGETDAGLVFICFQRELRTFTATQHRLDETDDLMRFVTPTASATFLILPGFSEEQPLRLPS